MSRDTSYIKQSLITSTCATPYDHRPTTHSVTVTQCPFRLTPSGPASFLFPRLQTTEADRWAKSVSRESETRDSSSLQHFCAVQSMGAAGKPC